MGCSLLSAVCLSFQQASLLIGTQTVVGFFYFCHTHLKEQPRQNSVSNKLYHYSIWIIFLMFTGSVSTAKWQLLHKFYRPPHCSILEAILAFFLCKS